MMKNQTHPLTQLTSKDYQGGVSTLCTGCGHDSVTKHIIESFYKSGIHPFDVAKLSGIGCSSKTPAYFMSMSHGFNSIHGRMPSVATGAKSVNKNLKLIGISGDGDTASIGIGSFLHLIRRNVPMIYIVENNGVYGLTKGQFSATADFESSQKSGEKNPFDSFDLCALALEAGCGFVARSFSGDGKQLVPLIAAAAKFNGTAFIDVISPCVTYANHSGSTKSYDYVKEHKLSLQELGYIDAKEENVADYEPGTTTKITLSDGSSLILKKLDTDHNTSSKTEAFRRLHQAKDNGEILTGLIYFDQSPASFVDRLGLPDIPLSHLTEKDLRPPEENLKSALKEFKQDKKKPLRLFGKDFPGN